MHSLFSEIYFPWTRRVDEKLKSWNKFYLTRDHHKVNSEYRKWITDHKMKKSGKNH